MMEEYVFGFLKVIGLIFSYGTLGYILLFAFNKQRSSFSFLKLFLSLFAGISLAVCLIAIYKTRGMTVNVILFFVIGYLAYLIRRTELVEPEPSGKIYFHPILVT